MNILKDEDLKGMPIEAAQSVLTQRLHTQQAHLYAALLDREAAANAVDVSDEQRVGILQQIDAKVTTLRTSISQARKEMAALKPQS